MRKSLKVAAMALVAAVTLGACQASQPGSTTPPAKPGTHHSRTLKAYTVTNPDGSRSDVCAFDHGKDLSRVMGDSDEPVRHPAGDAECNDPNNSN